MKLIVALSAVMVTSALALLRSVLGPTVFDRILAVNAFGTATVLLIAVLGFVTKRPDFLDLALTYTLMNFIGIIAVLKFTQYNNLGQKEDAEGEA